MGGHQGDAISCSHRTLLGSASSEDVCRAGGAGELSCLEEPLRTKAHQAAVCFEEFGSETDINGEVVDYSEEVVEGASLEGEGKDDFADYGKGLVVAGYQSLAGIRG